MTIREHRKKVRALLTKWGKTAEYCTEIQADIIKFQDLFEQVADIKPTTLDFAPKSNNPGDPTARAAADLEALRDLYADTIRHLTDCIASALRLQCEIDMQVRALSSAEQSVAIEKYRKGTPIVQMAAELNYSPSHIERLERQAVDKLRKTIMFQALAEGDIKDDGFCA